MIQLQGNNSDSDSSKNSTPSHWQGTSTSGAIGVNSKMAAHVDAVTRYSPLVSSYTLISLKQHWNGRVHSRRGYAGQRGGDGWRCERRQKGGKRSGVRARLSATLHKPAVPSVFFSSTSASWLTRWTRLICRSKAQYKPVQCWTEEATLSLQNCFEDTIWQLFESPDIELHTCSVLSYISFCMDSVTTIKQVKIFPNQKPWFNTNIRALLQARDSTLRSRHREAYRKARVDQNRGTKVAKTKYRKQIEANFKENNPCSMWKGI